MDVLQTHEVSLTNVEVLQFLKEQDKDKAQKKSKGTEGSLATLRLELITSLESSHTKAQLERSSAGDCPFSVWRDKMKSFNLTPSEELAVINQCPRSPVEVHLLIENSEERFTEDQVNELVDVVTSLLGSDTK